MTKLRDQVLRDFLQCLKRTTLFLHQRNCALRPASVKPIGKTAKNPEGFLRLTQIISLCSNLYRLSVQWIFALRSLYGMLDILLQVLKMSWLYHGWSYLLSTVHLCPILIRFFSLKMNIMFINNFQVYCIECTSKALQLFLAHIL